MYNLPKLNHKEIEYLNRQITSKEIDSIIKNLPMKESPGPEILSVNSTKHLERDIPILLKLTPKLKRRGRSQTHFTRLVLP